MALYTVFSYKRRPPRSVPEVMDALTAAAHVQPQLLVRARLARGHRRVHAHVLSTTTGLYDAAAQVHVGPGLTVLHGYAFRPGSGRPLALTASAMSDGFDDGVDLTEVDRWAGDYSIVHVDEGGVLTALSDLHRVQNVFWIDTPWVFGVSTRPSLLRLLAGDPGLDAEAIAAITASGYAFGDVTLHASIKAVPQGTALRWDGRHATLLDRDRVVRHPDPGGLDLGDGWVRDQLDAGVHEAAQSLELAHSSRGTIDLDITGGKDSRVVLAMCLAQGLGPRLRLSTRGPLDHPDVVVGRMLAERAGVPHRVVALPEATSAPAEGGTPVAESPEAYLGRLARHAFQTDGLVGGWDAFIGTRTGIGVKTSGLMGEVLKAFALTPYDPTGRPDPAAVVALQSPFDPLAVLTPWGRRVVLERLDRRFTELLDAGYTHADLPDLFYYENRVPNWLGHSKQVNTFLGTTLAPLGAVPLARLAFHATARQRQTELIPYTLIRRAAPELLDIPFALQTWDPSLRGAPQVDPVPLPVTSGSPVRAHGSWQYAAHDLEVRRRLRQLLKQVEAPAFHEAVDRDRLVRRLNGPPMSMRGIISLLGAVTVGMFVDGRVDDTKIRSENTAEPPVPYALQAAQEGRRWRPPGRGSAGWSVF